MTGGGNEDCAKFEKVVNKLIKSDSLYSFTIGSTPGFIIYIILFIGLMAVGINYGRQATYFNGVVIPGYGSLSKGYSLVDWMTSGLYKWYIVRQDMFFYTGKNSEGKSGTTTPEDEANFTELMKELRSPTYAPSLHYFCDKVLPCSGDSGAVNTACTCPGATGCLDKAGPSASAILGTKKKAAEYFFGIIPKCCCTKIGASAITSAPGYVATPSMTNNFSVDLPSCSDGSTTPQIPGASADSIKNGIASAMDCAKVNCKDEPDYKLLTIPLYTPTGSINPAWTEEANKYATPADILAATPSNVIQSALSDSTFSGRPGFIQQVVPNVVNANPIYKKTPYTIQTINSDPLNPPINNTIAKFTGSIELKKESPYAKIIDAQIKRLEEFKQPDNIETLLTQVPQKSKRLFKKK